MKNDLQTEPRIYNPFFLGTVSGSATGINLTTNAPLQGTAAPNQFVIGSPQQPKHSFIATGTLDGYFNQPYPEIQTQGGYWFPPSVAHSPSAPKNIVPWQIEAIGQSFQSFEEQNFQGTTTTDPLTDALRFEAMRFLDSAKDEDFEFGIESKLECKVRDFVLRHGSSGVEVLRKAFFSPSVSPNVLAEALAALGQVDSQNTLDERVEILQQGLSNRHGAVRRGAVTGLANMDDPGAVPSLQRVLEGERVEWVRNYINAALEQLQQKPTWRTS